jgi:hypothetical protein
MKASTFLIWFADTVVLALLYISEFHPNKYVDNILVLGRTWGMLQMAMIWAITLSFMAKVPSVGTINNALVMTMPAPRWKAWLGRLARIQGWLIAILSVGFGQWMLAFGYAMFSFGVPVARHYAKEYLNNVEVNKARKSAIINV